MKTHALISQAYSAFNHRDIEAALALMGQDVSWPKASEGGRVIGKDAIREYWLRQWSTFDPRVDVLEIIEPENGKAEVRVHQLVKNLEGEVISDTEVRHLYTIHEDLIQRMDLAESDSNTEGPSSAFKSHGH